MKTANLYSLFFLCFFILLASCQKEEKMQIFRPIGGQVISGYEPCTQLNLGILGSATLDVSGGGVWSVISNNETIVKATKETSGAHFYIRVSSCEQGMATITVTGENGETIELPVSVGTSTKEIVVMNPHCSMIEGGSKEDSLAILKVLFDDVVVQKYGTYNLTFETKNSGTLLVRTFGAPDGKLLTGTFTIRGGSVDHSEYILSFDGKILKYAAMPYGRSVFGEIETRALEPLRFYFVEDVTSVYQKRYPAVSRVLRAQEVRMSLN